ncbi:MAG: HAD family hydrolase [Lachnospiraceae bacterium]|nr:HAD family hydrolase [Lachnospiraceae bacterium]
MKKGIIFDMDGTLWDSAEGVAASWNQVLKEHGLDRRLFTVEDIHGVMGKTLDVIADIFFADMDRAMRGTIMEECCAREQDYLAQHGGRLYPNVPETLRMLREKYPLYIVSNCQRGYIEGFLQYYGLGDLIEDTECFGNNGRQKGENIALVAERNGLTDAVYVGDIEGDYAASRAAGVRFIHAAYGFGFIEEPVAAVQEFRQLVQTVEEIW